MHHAPAQNGLGEPVGGLLNRPLLFFDHRDQFAAVVEIIGARSHGRQHSRRPSRQGSPDLGARAKITSGFSESFHRGIVTLLKIRNPKLEIRNKPEEPKSKSQYKAASPYF